MPVDHREKPFEAAIEDSLLSQGGYAKADPRNFDKERCLDPTILLSFLKETQPKEWTALEKLHGGPHGTGHPRRSLQSARFAGRSRSRMSRRELFVSFFATTRRFSPIPQHSGL